MDSWIQLLAAAGVGAALTQYIARARERREVRASVMRALSAVEESRWAGDRHKATDFQEAAAELEVAAIIAGISRTILVQYLILADAARQMSQASWDEYPDPETGGGIHSPFSDAVRRAARMVADSVWHPYLTRIRQRSNLKALQQAIAKLNSAERQAIEQRRDYSRW